MARQTRMQRQRRRYVRRMRLSVPTGEPHSFLLWDSRVRWVRVGASAPLDVTTVTVGRHCRFCLRCGVDTEGRFALVAEGYFPALSGASHRFVTRPVLLDEAAPVTEKVRFVDQRGTLSVQCEGAGLEMEHTFYAATQSIGLVERLCITNTGEADRTLTIRLGKETSRKGEPAWRCEPADEDGKMLSGMADETTVAVPAGQSAVRYVVYYALKPDSDLLVDCRLEYKKRLEGIEECFDTGLRLRTPDPVLNAAFAHAATLGMACCVDTPAGVLAMDMPCGLTLDTWLVSTVYCALSGHYRGIEACETGLKGFAALYRVDHVPAAIRDDGTPEGEGDVWQYALGCALCSLYGTDKHPDLYEGLRALWSRQDAGETLAQSSVIYAAYRLAAVWASVVAKPQDGAIWLQHAAHVADYIEQRYGQDALYRTKDNGAAIALPLMMDLDARAPACAKQLCEVLFDGALLYRNDRAKVAFDADTLYAVAALQNTGYHDAAYGMWSAYTQAMMLCDAAPCPHDRRDREGMVSLKESLLYCAVATAGLFGLRPLGHSLYVCPHLPAHWTEAGLEHLHYGGRVLTLTWRADTLTVTDLYGATVYQGTVFNGQSVVIPV